MWTSASRGPGSPINFLAFVLALGVILTYGGERLLTIATTIMKDLFLAFTAVF